MQGLEEGAGPAGRLVASLPDSSPGSPISLPVAMATPLSRGRCSRGKHRGRRLMGFARLTEAQAQLQFLLELLVAFLLGRGQDFQNLRLGGIQHLAETVAALPFHLQELRAGGGVDFLDAARLDRVEFEFVFEPFGQSVDQQGRAFPLELAEPFPLGVDADHATGHAAEDKDRTNS